MFDQLLNNIPLLTAIIVVIMLIAVGLVLYFLVFKDKIKAKIEEIKAKKAERARKIEEAKVLAAEILKKKDDEPAFEDDRAERIIKGTMQRFVSDDAVAKKKTKGVTDTEADFDFNLLKGKMEDQAEKKGTSETTDTEADFDFDALKTPKNNT